MKIGKNFLVLITSKVNTIPVAKISKALWGRERHMDTIMEPH